MSRQRQLRAINQALDNFIGDLVQEITLEVTEQLVATTPVDTGWARANWVPQIGSPFSSTAGTRSEAENGFINAGVQENGIAAVATTYRLDQGEVFVTNNVPYITSLNQGSSSQAPTDFVPTSIATALRRVLQRAGSRRSF